MALDKIDFSSIFGDRIGGIDFINDLITGENTNEMGVENSNGIKIAEKTINFFKSYFLNSFPDITEPTI